MKGQVLDYSVQSNTGVITGADGSRYTFAGSEWNGATPPARGVAVDFNPEGRNALSVYKALVGSGAAGGAESKDRMTAGLLALFLGWLGAHKFYLGFTGPGLVFLLINTAGWLVTWIVLGIPNIVMGIFALVEGVVYLTKSDEEFHQLYVVERKPWF